MLNRFKSWLVRKLGGEKTVYAEKVVIKNFQGERVCAAIDVPDEYSLNRELTVEGVRREIAGKFAEYIFENMPQENISVEKIYSSRSTLYKAYFWIDYDCNLQRRSG